MRQALRFSVLLSVCLLLSGCWDYIEVETLTFVMGAGIDTAPGQGLSLTVETFEVQGGDTSELKPYVAKATGLSLFNALRNMTNITGRQMFFGHSHTVIFSEEFAREGVGQAVGFMQRDVGVRTNMWLFVVRGATAEEVFKAESPLGTSVGHYFNQVMLVQERNPTYIPVQMWEFNRALSGEGIAPTMPVIELIEFDDQIIPKVEGSAVFDGDRLAGWLDGRDTRILSYLQLRRLTGVLVTELQFHEEVEVVAAEVSASKVKIEPQWKDEKLSMEISINVHLDLHEIGFSKLDYSQFDLKRMLEEAFARQLKNDIEHMLATVQQELRLDVIGLGNITKKQAPDAWRKLSKDWDKVYPNLPVNVRVAALINETGLLGKPLQARD